MLHQLNGLSSMATRQVLAELSGAFEQRSGIRVAVRSMGGVEAARLVRAGEATDVVVLAADVIGQLEAEGHIAPGSKMAVARSGIAMAVRSGAPQPAAADEVSVKQATLEARSICYSTGPSGDHLKRLWERWGIAELVSRRALQAPPGVPVAALVAQGDADLGFQQLSEMLHVPGIEIVGLLPPEIQVETVFTAGIASMSSRPEETRAFIEYLISPDADAAKRRHGMEPPKA